MEDQKISEVESVNPITVINPLEGLNVLDYTQIEKTVPPVVKNNPVWLEIDQYDQKCLVSAELLRQNSVISDSEESTSIECETEKEYSLEVYRHKPNANFLTKHAEDDKPLWQAFDILYEPEWKMITSKYLGGLTESDVAIVRLLKNDNDGTGISFCSLYINNNMYSKYFSDKRRLQREGKIDPSIEISIEYDVDACMNTEGDFPLLMDAFKYAWGLNLHKPFPIIEQIRDYRDGNSQVLLSNIDPKTEIRTEYNIFINLDKPRSVLTNFRPQIFMCEYCSERNSFIVTKKR